MWKLYDCCSPDGVNQFSEWTRKLQKVQRIKLRAKLDMLARDGLDLPPQLLAGPICEHIYKLKVKGNVQLRPLLCRGPFDNETEFTLLAGAKEIQGELEPRGVEDQAIKNRQAVIANPNRRCRHERID